MAIRRPGHEDSKGAAAAGHLSGASPVALGHRHVNVATRRRILGRAGHQLALPLRDGAEIDMVIEAVGRRLGTLD